MIINSVKSLFTYSCKESLNLMNSPSIADKNAYSDYHNFINSILVIYGDQKENGTIPVFWTRIKNNDNLEREPDPNSTLKELKYNYSYYIHVIKDKLPIKIPQIIDSIKFLNNQKTQKNTEPCFNNSCDTPISIVSDTHRNISLNSDTGHSTDIHIAISGLLPNKNYTYTIEPMHSNWPHKITKSSGVILRNSPLNNYGSIQSSIDTKFLYLYMDGINNINNSLPHNILDISKRDHAKNIFSLLSVKIYDDKNNIKLIDTINILCNTCVPTPTIGSSPTPTPSVTATFTPTPTKTATVTPTVSIANNPNYYFIGRSVSEVCYISNQIVSIYGDPTQLYSIAYKDPSQTIPWTINELRSVAGAQSSDQLVYIKNRFNIVTNNPNANRIISLGPGIIIVGVEQPNSLPIPQEVAVFISNNLICPTPTPTPTRQPTPTPTSTPTVTPSSTGDEFGRKCPYIRTKEKNIILTDQNYHQINVEFFNINPFKQYAYEIISNQANWPISLSSQKSVISNYVTYRDNGLLYGSGNFDIVLSFNNNFGSESDINFTLPNYLDEKFFDINKFVNLSIRMSTYVKDLGYNIRLENQNNCFISDDNINVLCSGCVNVEQNKDCIESVSVNIANTGISVSGSELLLPLECCHSNNAISANISGLCPENPYMYEWSSYPSIAINPVSGIISVGDDYTTINTIFNLKTKNNISQLSNLKLKITDLTTNKYAEDNILLRCNDGCYKATRTPTPSATATPTITPTISLSPNPTPTPTKTQTQTPTASLTPTASQTPTPTQTSAPLPPCTILLDMKMEGVNNSTIFTDSSPYNLTFTAYGDAKITTSTKKFGNSSASFFGPNSYLRVNSSTLNTLSTSFSQPFTIEAWVYPTEVNEPTSPQIIISCWASDNTWNFGLTAFAGHPGLYGFFIIAGTPQQHIYSTIGHGSQIILNSWNHIAICRYSSGNARIFINGVGGPQSPANFVNAGVNFDIGGYSLNTLPLKGYMDNLLIVKNRALYLDDFDINTWTEPVNLC